MVVFAFLALAWSFLYQNTAGESVAADVSLAAETCEHLQSLLGSIITLPSDAQYLNLTQENWSQTTWQQPTCIGVPNTSSDVSSLIKVLVQKNVPFAIRSGGHSPNPRDASISTGVLISMEKFNQVSYDKESGLTSMGPGARWEEVYDELDKYNVTIVGGRVMNVGVGGLTLGSGLSYLSDLYGLVCDNVVSYEVVLADGSIVKASADSNHELFWGLKGGTNNFGIITQFKSTTYPIFHGWGGMQIFNSSQMAALLEAFYEYQSTPNKDLYANMIINLVPTNGSLILTMIYLKPVEHPDAFKPFYNLTPIFEQVGFMTLHELMSLFPPATLPRWTWYVHAFEPSKDLYAKISNLIATAPEVATIGALTAGTLVAAVQPISASAVLAGRARGGNALGLQAVNQTWWSFSSGWWDAADDATAQAAVRSLHDKVGALAADAGVLLDFLFMNDANIDQKVIASYGAENVQRLHAVQKAYDPNLVFRKLVPGGQKIPGQGWQGFD